MNDFDELFTLYSAAEGDDRVNIELKIKQMYSDLATSNKTLIDQNKRLLLNKTVAAPKEDVDQASSQPVKHKLIDDVLNELTAQRRK